MNLPIMHPKFIHSTTDDQILNVNIQKRFMSLQKSLKFTMNNEI